jgi:crossover junction endodeoxyribonuclease RuvC
MFVVGIDPGLTRCGFGGVRSDLDLAESFTAVAAGVLETDPHAPVEQRLAALHVDLASLFDDLQPDAVVVEKVFFQKNVRTAISVAQASGVAVALAGIRGIPVVQYTAQEVKLAVTGYGAASKAQVQAMVAERCGIQEVPQPADAADALGLALCHLSRVRIDAKYAAGVVQ